MSVGCSSAAQAPGPNQGPETPVPLLRPDVAPWVRRLLLTALLVLCGWLLFVATSGVARADDGDGGACRLAPLDVQAADPSVLTDGGLAEPSSVVCPVATVPDPPPVIDTPAPEAPAPVVVPDVPPVVPPVVDEVPPVVPDAAPAPVTVPEAAPEVVVPLPDPPAVVEAAVVDVPAPQAVATPQPARTSVDTPPTVAVAADPAPLLAAPEPPAEVACAEHPGLLVRSPASPPVVTGAGLSIAQPSAVTPAPAVHHGPLGPPAPLDLPPPGPAPTCPAAGAFAGTSGCGTGHGQHTYGDHVVLGSRSTTLAAGPAQADSSAADEAVGATDDPGTRPG